MKRTSKTRKPKSFVVKAAVFSALRRSFRNYPAFKEVLDDAKTEYFIKSKHGKDLRRVQFECNGCKESFKRTEVNVDHIEPVIPLEGLPGTEEHPDFNIYIERLFCSKSNLQILCKTCHKKKSNEEKKQRDKIRKQKAK